MSKPKQKLFVSKWVLFLKRIHFLLLKKRWVPWFRRKTCTNCSFVYNKDMFKVCPFCDHGDGVVWVVTVDNEIDSIFNTKEKAEYRIDSIKQEYNIRAAIQYHKVW